MTTDNDTKTDSTERECWLAQSGKEYKKADRERLALTEERAEEILGEWRAELGYQDDRWFGVTQMRAVVADTDR